MKKLGLALLGIVMVLAGPVWASVTAAKAEPPLSPDPKTARVIWTGKSGGVEIRWTTADIQAWPVKKPDRLVFSAFQLAHLGFQRIISPANLGGEEERVTYERKFTLVSVVGSIVSLKDELYYNIQPSAHPGLETRFTAIDLAKSGEVPDPWAEEDGLSPGKLGKVAQLTDYFPEDAVLRALLNDPIIKATLESLSPTRHPRSLEELSRLMEDQQFSLNEVPYLWPRDFLTRFGFHHLQGDKVAVRLGLPSAGGAARGLHAELGLLLPIPPGLKKPLALAAAGRMGFLMQDRQKVADDGAAVIYFDQKIKKK